MDEGRIGMVVRSVKREGERGAGMAGQECMGGRKDMELRSRTPWKRLSWLR